MPLDSNELLRIDVEVNDRDPILQRVTNQDMIRYLAGRKFNHVATHDTGLAAYVHSGVMVQEGENRYPFNTAIDTKDNGSDTRRHAGNVKQFLYDMQRFYRLKGESRPTQLQILNDLL